MPARVPDYYHKLSQEQKRRWWAKRHARQAETRMQGVPDEDQDPFEQFNQSRQERGHRPASYQDWVRWGKPPRSGMVRDPGDPGVRTPTPEPFLGGDDLSQIAQFVSDWEAKLQDLDFNLEQSRINTDYQKGQSDKQAGEAKTATTDEMIGRGLFRSSIRDGELADIDRMNAARKALLDTSFANLQLYTDRQKRVLHDAKSRFDDAMRQRAVENASQAAQNAPPFTQEPRPPGWVDPPAQPQQPSPAPQRQSSSPAVSWNRWRSWSPQMRARYRARHRGAEWERYRPR